MIQFFMDSFFYSLIFNTLFIPIRVAGGLEPIPAATVREAGNSSDGSTVTNNHAHSHSQDTAISPAINQRSKGIAFTWFNALIEAPYTCMEIPLHIVLDISKTAPYLYDTFTAKAHRHLIVFIDIKTTSNLFEMTGNVCCLQILYKEIILHFSAHFKCVFFFFFGSICMPEC